MKHVARRAILPVGIAIAIAGCASTATRTPAAKVPAPVLVEEAFASAMTPRDNIDSPTSWQAPDGSVRVIASAKATDRLVVFDGASGATLGAAGGTGRDPGEFDRPNGVFALDDVLFVVERNNHRVQLLSLPEFESLLVFGTDELIKPYGIWVGRADGGYVLHVTDAYETADEQVPPLAELDRRVKRFLVTRDGARWQARFDGSYGDTSPEGALRIVESIWADPANDNMLIAEEDESWANEIKVYSLAGTYKGIRFGADVLDAQAEGIALYACDDGGGYWLATAQGNRQTTFHVFDRTRFTPVGAFVGSRVANTDGVWLTQQASTRFPAGAFYAVHDDQGVVAFDWRDIAGALDLRADCIVPAR